MKKLKTTIEIENGESKQITVYVDDRTAELLDQCDEHIRQIYLEEE